VDFLDQGVRKFKRGGFRRNGEILQFDPPTGRFLPWP
jgi:hypothetical protein